MHTFNKLRERFLRLGSTIAQVLALLVVSTLVGAYVLPVFADFQPGETLDPNCLPSDSSCTVNFASTTGAIWGNITGSVSNQTDLQNILDEKVSTTSLDTLTDLPSLSVVGTIGAGVWNGTAIADGYFDKTGDWQGTFGGQDSSYYLDATNLNNLSTMIAGSLAGLTTDDVAEGPTNKYYSDTYVDARINGLMTIADLAILPSLYSVGTIDTGVWNATPIADGYFDKTGDWQGTLGGQLPSYYLDANNLANLSSAIVANLAGISTDDVPEGSINKYYTDGAVDARIDLLSTLPNITTLAALNTVGTINTGVWNGTQIADGYLDKTGDWQGTFDSHTSSYYLDALNLNNFSAAVAGEITGLSTDDISEGTINKYYTDIKVNNVLAASTTLVKTYANNIFSGTNTFTGALTFSDFPQKSGSLIPTHDYDFTPKSYVDSLIVGQSARGSARVVTLAALPTVIYDNGASGVGATLTADANGAISMIDGMTVMMGDRILIKDQADPTQNGVYDVTQVGDISNPFILTRSTDYDSPSKVTNGSFIPITSGLTYSNTVWIMTSIGAMTVGSTDINFTQLSISPASYTSSQGIQINSNDFQLDIATNEGLTFAGNSLKVDYDNSTLGIVNNKLAAMNIGSAATNTLPYYATAGSVLSGASGLFTTGTKLGIGTSTPDSLLDIYQNVAGASNAFAITNPSSSASAYSNLQFFNDTANASGISFNSSSRSNDAGASGLTMYNNAGGFRLRANGATTFATGGAPGTDRMTITATGNVGIGTTSPGSLLTVAGNFFTTGTIGVGTSSPAANIAITASGSSGVTNALLIANASNQGKFVVLDNGKVGVGTTTSILAGLVVNTTGLIGGANISAYDIGAGRIAAGQALYSYGAICAANQLGTCAGTGGVVIGSSSNPLAHINLPLSGTSFFTDNVAIGTTTAVAKLMVGYGQGFSSYNQSTNARPLIEATNLSGQLQASIGVGVNDGTLNPRIALFADAASSTYGLAASYSTGSQSMVFRNASSEYMRITASGLVGIGTTTPTQKLSISNGSIALNNGYIYLGNNYNLRWFDNTGTTSASVLGVTTANNVQLINGFTSGNIHIYNTSSTGLIQLYSSSTERMRIAATGNVSIGHTITPSRLYVYQPTTLEASKQGILTTVGNYSGPYSTDITGNNLGINLTDMDQSAGVVYGNVFSSTILGTTTVASTIYNNYNRPYMQGSGVIANVESLTIDPYFYGANATGSWTNYSGIRVGAGAYGGGATGNVGTVTQIRVGNPSFGTSTKYGLRIDNITGAAVSNYSIYSGTAPSYFAGNIGIGTSAATAPLHVLVSGASSQTLLRLQNSIGSLSSTANIDFSVSNGTATQGRVGLIRTNRIASGDSDMFFNVSTGGTLTERMRLMDNGNLGIGSTTPAYRLTVSGTVGFTGVSAAGSSYAALCLNSATGEVVVNTGTQTCTVSSARFKHSIETLTATSGLAFVNQLRPVSFTLNTGGEQRLGFIAEEINALDSRLVGFEADGVTPRTVRYEEMTAVLAKAIQELDLKVSTMASSSASTTISAGAMSADWLIGSLRAFGITMTEALVHIKAATIQALTVKSLTIESESLESSGVTIQDRGTGNKVCMYVENGAVKTSLGPCAASTVVTVVPTETESIISTSTATSTIQEGSTENSTTTATTTPNIENDTEESTDTTDTTATTSTESTESTSAEPTIEPANTQSIEPVSSDPVPVPTSEPAV